MRRCVWSQTTLKADEEPPLGLKVEESSPRKWLAALPGPSAPAWKVISPVSGQVVTGNTSNAQVKQLACVATPMQQFAQNPLQPPPEGVEPSLDMPSLVYADQ